MPLISMKQAGKKYLPKTFDLEINKSDFILVSGDNGNGKTTLIQLVLGKMKIIQSNQKQFSYRCLRLFHQLLIVSNFS